MDTKKTLGLAGNYMNVEETIHALLELEKAKLNYESQSVHRAIDLLKRGEKFEKMWEELYTEYGMCPIRKNDEEGYMSNILYKILEELQQKYFPIITKVKDEKKT